MTLSYDVTIDDRGWAQAQNRSTWRPSDLGRTRWGLPWTPAEDRALLRQVGGARSISWADPTIRAAATTHGRSSSAIVTRVGALKTGIRLAMAAKRESRSTASTPPTSDTFHDSAPKDEPHMMTATPTPMTIRPLHDRILVKRTEAETKSPGGLFIPDAAKEKPVEGLVVAVGDGTLNKDGARIPLDVKAGDRILFSKYSGTEVKVMLDGGEHLILREDDVLAVIG